MNKTYNFTFIHHEIRKELGLSMNEYAVAELIYHLSADPDPAVPGWCHASKERLGGYLGLSEQSIHTILNKLLRLKLVEKHPETRHLRSTKGWYDKVITSDTKESLATLKKVEPDTKESLAQTLKNLEPSTYDSNNDSNTYRENKENKEKNVTSVTETSSLEVSPVKPKTLTKVSLPPLKYATLADLTETDFSEIAEHYQLPLAFVRSKYDDMCLWAGERPGNPKLRGRNWRLTLMAWVKKDALRITERSKGDPSKRSIDARNL